MRGRSFSGGAYFRFGSIQSADIHTSGNCSERFFSDRGFVGFHDKKALRRKGLRKSDTGARRTHGQAGQRAVHHAVYILVF